MGIGRLVMTGPREVITARDDALDREAEGFAPAWEEYGRTLDVAVIRPFLKPGVEPAVFVVDGLTLAQHKAIEDMTRWSDRLFGTLAYGVREIRGVPIIDEKGQTVEIKRVKGEAGDRLPEVALAIFRDERIMLEVYARVRQATGLSPEVRKSDPA